MTLKSRRVLWLQALINGLVIGMFVFGLWFYRAWAAPGYEPFSEEGNSAVIPYQGMLTDTSGQPIDGQIEMRFRIYKVPTGGTPLWEEAYTDSNAIYVEQGLFQVNLGSLVPIPKEIWEEAPLYLGIQVGSDAEMTPRPIIGSAPYALHVAANSVSSSSVIDGSLTRKDFAAMTGVEWKVPPVVFVEGEGVRWTPQDNAIWDIGPYLDQAGVPTDAEVLLLGWRPSRLSDVARFEFLDANNNKLGEINLGVPNTQNAWTPLGPEFGTLIPVPGNTRKIKYALHGADYQDAIHPRRVLIIYGWK